ncbi:hypothetical protein PA905_29040 [Planktothrix agardhii CCAP 1459/11A]|uniref:Uncharacterized protein n=1 Tax=Planktothrix agardhii CCAP 1459/11A TaxID=282420 RepID=A0A479ZR55_PLAAG|nr:hypothetical protein PA905_29040 [Planktothrix agardhii CCAP 1459/11A]
MSDDTNPNLSSDTSENTDYEDIITELPVPCPPTPTPTPDKPKA